MADYHKEICFEGCKPDPVASYLKGLGVFRIIAEQIDPSARCRWKSDRMELTSTLSKEEIREFFLHSYKPTPVTTPWNGGSGFFPKDKGAREKGLHPIKTSQSCRFDLFRDVILFCENALQHLNLTEKPGGPDIKIKLLKTLRADCPDIYLDWLDAAFVLSEKSVNYPPLLGTGGIDGRFDFSSAYMQRIVSLFDMITGAPLKTTPSFLDAALFEDVTSRLLKESIGQFYPGAAGGFNSTAGFTADGIVNPWDFVLLIEGSILFAAAAHKRMGTTQTGVPVAPFTVHTTPAGYGSSSGADISGRAEIWIPLWKKWISLEVLRHFLAEGRVTVGRRKAATGTDFARAISGLGIAGGIHEFHRFGIQERFGQSNLATSLGRWKVRRNPDIDLLEELDPWMHQLRNVCKSDKTPGRIFNVWNAFENSLMRFSRQADTLSKFELITSIVNIAAVQDLAWQFCAEKFLSPVPLLSTRWIENLDDNGPEMLIGKAIGAIGGTDKTPGFREHIEPVEKKGSFYRWVKDKVPAHVTYTGEPVKALGETALRRFSDAFKQDIIPLPVTSKRSCPVWAINAFLNRQIDFERLDVLIRFSSMIRWDRKEINDTETSHKTCVELSSTYTLLKLCHLPFNLDGYEITYDPSISALLHTGNLSEAIRTASRRLTVSGLPPKVTHVPNDSDIAKRCLAALLIPVRWYDFQHLVQRDILPDKDGNPRKISVDKRSERS